MEKKPSRIEKLEMQLEEERQKRNQEIRRLYATGDWTYQMLAEKFDLTKQRIEKIVKMKE